LQQGSEAEALLLTERLLALGTRSSCLLTCVTEALLYILCCRSRHPGVLPKLNQMARAYRVDMESARTQWRCRQVNQWTTGSLENDF